MFIFLRFRGERRLENFFTPASLMLMTRLWIVDEIMSEKTSEKPFRFFFLDKFHSFSVCSIFSQLSIPTSFLSCDGTLK